MISEVFIRRPVTAIVISLVIVLVGIIAIINLPVSQYPSITPPVVSVAGNYTGADAQTVEQTVTTPIETQINGTPASWYIATVACMSRTRSEGESTSTTRSGAMRAK